MFSHIVTTARGLLNGQDESTGMNGAATDTTMSNHTNPSQSSTMTPERSTTATENKMTPETELKNEHSVTNGKRKSQPTESKNASSRKDTSNKRRKASDETENGSVTEESKRQETGSAPGKHFRFGSEEPELPRDAQSEETTEETVQPDGQNDNEDSSDDEAPETVDNSAQLSSIKAEAKRREKAKQIEEQSKRDKRRQLDALHKSQALNKKKDGSLEPPKFTTIPDDLASESSTTLQGSTTENRRRQALPALLPEEILNAAPAARPPTPPADETEYRQRKPNKLKFLDRMEKPPKDVRMGDMTIRVLDDSAQKKSMTSLAPKASKAGRNSKENWLKKERSTARVNGLRRTAGGTSGFVRR